VSIEDSSQFASALLLCANVGNWEIEVVGENAEESPYVVMTLKLIEAFPRNAGSFQIEPDASSGSYFWAAGWILSVEFFRELLKTPRELVENRIREAAHVRVSNWPDSGWQLDADFTVFISGHTESIPIEISRAHDLADSIMTAIVLSPLAKVARERITFTDLGRLRVQECERVFALRTELTKCGAKVIEEGDTLTVFPSQLHGAEIETYNDHRMAMCFAVLGLKVPGIEIKNPSCVKKTFPNFFQKLAAAPPAGLGAKIRDAKTGRELSHEELFAD
jgi:3-phosphoshikimate 1-carboxyvinyltransferase